MSMDRWIKKMWSIHTMEYDSALKKKETLPYATAWMNMKYVMFSEIIQTQRDTC